jgi:ADP-ribose pyrophosphatase
VSTANVVHENPWFGVTHEHRGSGGAQSEWFRVIGPDSAMVIPVDDDGRVILLRGVRDTTGPDEHYELPCGAVDAGESVEAAALRELREETGYTAKRCEPLGSFYDSPGISARRTSVFAASELHAGPQRLESGEAWVVVAVNRAELAGLIREGRIVDAGTLAALAQWACASTGAAG